MHGGTLCGTPDRVEAAVPAVAPCCHTGTVIDLHCHILPGVDDGPADVRHSIEMALQADRDGIHTIVATPHIRHDHDVQIHELSGRVADLNEAITSAGAAVQVLTGGEVAETIVAHLTDVELTAVSLGGGGRWVLVEPKPGPLSDTLDHAVMSLHERGFGSLIAHPERHLSSDLLQRLQRLVGHGALIQATAATMCDPPADKGMRILAAAGLIHVLSSDSHHPRMGREVALSAGLQVLGGIDPVAEYLPWVTEIAPTAMITGVPVTVPYPVSLPDL